MKILVTGGAGFIGSEFVRQILSEFFEVHVLDSLTYAGNLDALSEIIDKVKFEKIDIRDTQKLSDFFEKNCFSHVVNFAAETHVDNSINSPRIFLETNVIGVFNLLEQCRKHKFRFIQISTDEVYGSIDYGEFLEDDRLNPSSPYSASKASAELIINSYVTTYGIDALGVRCSNNYGPFQNSEKLIPFFISRASKGLKLPLYGLGLNVREWIHVKDSVSGIIKVLRKGKTGSYYNISSGNFYTNIEVTHKILNYFGLDESSIEFVNDRLGHDFRYAINSQKIRSELGWYPRVDFNTGLKSTIDWYMSHPEYLTNVS